jgi:hypothetical protein
VRQCMLQSNTAQCCHSLFPSWRVLLREFLAPGVSRPLFRAAAACATYTIRKDTIKTDSSAPSCLGITCMPGMLWGWLEQQHLLSPTAAYCSTKRVRSPGQHCCCVLLSRGLCSTCCAAPPPQWGCCQSIAKKAQDALWTQVATSNVPYQTAESARQLSDFASWAGCWAAQHSTAHADWPPCRCPCLTVTS